MGCLLLGVVELEGKVLPLRLVHGDRVQRLSVAVEDLEVVLVTRRLADDLSGLEHDLVRRVVGRLMPHVLPKISFPSCSSNIGSVRCAYKVFMRQVQRPRSILLDAEVQRLHTRLPWSISRILQELQARAPESLLLLEDALVADGDLDGDVVCAVEARRRDVGELENAGPLQVVALDVVGIEDGVGGVGVGDGRVGYPAAGNAAVENDRALDVGASLEEGGREGAPGGKENGSEGLAMHDFDNSELDNRLER